MAQKPKSVLQLKMLEARQHIKVKEYEEAQAILERIDQPTAKEWLKKIHDIWFDKAERLIRAKRHEEAIALLKIIHHPKAEKWLDNTEKLMLKDDPFTEDAEEDKFDDPFVEKEAYLPKTKAKPEQDVDWDVLHKQRLAKASSAAPKEQLSKLPPRQLTTDFTTKAIVVLILYFVLWIPGIVANILWYREAKEVEKIYSESPPGKGCLRAMLLIFVVVPFFLFLFAMMITVMTLIFAPDPYPYYG